MTKPLEIPTTHETITTGWLTDALRTSKTISATNVQWFAMEMLSAGQVGKVARLTLHYVTPEENAPTTVIAKLSNPNPEIRAHMDKMNMYEKEVRFYQELAPQIDLPSPQCYYSDYDERTGHCILLLEDLSRLRAIDRIEGCQKADAELVLSHLARFHAQWWDSPRLQSMPYLTPFNHQASYSQERFQEWWPMFLEKLAVGLPEIALPESFRRLGYQFGSRLAETLTTLNQSPVTIVHQDVGVDNLLFGARKTDPPLLFFDWQLVGYGRGVSDVTYFMIFAVPTTVRRQEERHLLQTYHRLLEEAGVQGYEFNQCWSDYKLAFFRNLLVAVNVITLSDITNPHLNATAKALIPRMIAFSEDHNVGTRLS